MAYPRSLLAYSRSLLTYSRGADQDDALRLVRWAPQAPGAPSPPAPSHLCFSPTPVDTLGPPSAAPPAKLDAKIGVTDTVRAMGELKFALMPWHTGPGTALMLHVVALSLMRELQFVLPSRNPWKPSYTCVIILLHIFSHSAGVISGGHLIYGDLIYAFSNIFPHSNSAGAIGGGHLIHVSSCY